MMTWIQIMVLCSAIPLLAAGSKPNFTGTRKADVAKSTMTSTPRKNIDPDAPPGPPPPPADMAFKMMPPETITHKEPELVIQSGANALRLTTDGKDKFSWKALMCASLERDGKTLIHDNTVRTSSTESISHIIWLPSEIDRK